MSEQVAIEVVIKASKSAKTMEELAKSSEALAEALGQVQKDSKAFKTLEKELDKTAKKYNDVVKETDKAEMTINDLEKAQESLLEELKNTDRGTERYKELSNTLVDVKREVANTELSLVALNSEDVTGAFSQLTGAIGGVTSAFILLGSESNSTLKEIGTNIQTALGITQAFTAGAEGINAVRKLWRRYKTVIMEATVVQKVFAVGTKVLNAIMNANPVFILIGAFTALIGVFKLWSASQNKAAESAKKLAEAQENLTAKMELQERQIQALADAKRTEIDNNNALLTSEEKLLKSKGDLTEADKQRLKDIEKLKKEGEIEKLDVAVNESYDKFANQLKNIGVQYTEVFQATKATDFEDGINDINYDGILAKNKELAVAFAEIGNEGFTKENVDAQIKAITALETKQQSFSNRTRVAYGKLGTAEQEFFEQTKDVAGKMVTNLDKLKATAIAYKNALTAKDTGIQLQKESDIIEDNAEALAKREERRRKWIAKRDKQKADEEQRLKDLAVLEEQLFQDGLETQQDVEARKLTLIFEANLKKAEKLIKDEDALELAKKQIRQKAFKDMEALEKKYLDLDKKKQKEILHNAQKTQDDLLVLEQESLMIESNAIEDAVERQKVQDAIIVKLNKAKIKKIENQRDRDLENEKLTEQERVLITKKAENEILAIKDEARAKNAETRQEQLEKEKEIQQQLIEAGFEAVQQIADFAFEITAQQRERQLEDQLESVASMYDEELALLNEQLKRGRISQEKFDKEKEKIEKQKLQQEEKLKKQAFEKDKEASIAQAVINGALAITQAFAQLGPIAGAISAALVGVTTALQIATISSQQYADGGILVGASHDRGGIPTPFGELEGGEAVINKRSTEMFKEELSTINQVGGGIAFADGGVLGGGSTTTMSSNGMSGTLSQLNETLKRPIRAYVTETELVNSGSRRAEIIRNSTL